MLSTKISDTDNFSFCYFESFLKLPLKHCCRVFLSLGTSAEKVESRTVSKKRFRQPLKRKKDKGGTFKCLNSGHRSCSLRTCPLPLSPQAKEAKKQKNNNNAWSQFTGLVTPEFVFERQSHSNKWYSGRNSRIEDLWLELKRIPKPNVVNTAAKNKVEKGENDWIEMLTVPYSIARVLSNYARPVRRRTVQLAKENWNHVPWWKETSSGPHSM